MRPLLIGIGGGSASGKSTLAAELVRDLAPSAVLIALDSYYLHRPEIPFAERIRSNYDDPSAFDFPLLNLQLAQLLRGEAIQMPSYDFTLHERSPSSALVNSASVILLEGILALRSDLIAAPFDLKVYVEASEELRFARRLERDQRERGRTEELIRTQWMDSVEPMFIAHCEPCRGDAEIIVREPEDIAKVRAAIVLLSGRP